MQRSYVNSGNLRSLHPILKEWIRLNRTYSKRMQWEDCAWWANERASTGILAAAAWMAGGVALEEYSTKKVKKKEHRTGSCDLFFDVRIHGWPVKSLIIDRKSTRLNSSH